MLKIQEYIKNFVTIQDANYFLSQEFDINIRKDKLEDDVVYIYNYGQNSNKMNSLSNEARGLILDSEGQVVCQTLPRFFEPNDPASPELDWDHATAEQKVDGTLITVYNHKNKFYIATKHHPKADINIANFPVTYKLAIEIFLHRKASLFRPNSEWYNWFKTFKKEYCFVFEFIGPENRIVTSYKRHDLVLLTIIDKINNIECSKNIIRTFSALYGIPTPKIYPVSNSADIIDLIDTSNITDAGFIITDKKNVRQKFINPSWRILVDALKIKNEQVSPDVFAQIALENDNETIISYFPEYEKFLNLFKNVLDESKAEAEYLWFEYQDANTNKEFAENVKHHWLSGLLFAAYNKHVNYPLDAIDVIKPSTLVTETKRRFPDQYENEFKAISKIVGGYR